MPKKISNNSEVTTTESLVEDYLLKQGSHRFMLNFVPEEE